MSGIDEQRRDVTPCGCEKYRYWTIYRGDTPSSRFLLGYLNPDSWIDAGHRASVNLLDGRDRRSKDALIDKIGIFYCEFCEREIKRGHEMFEKMCSEVRVRWGVERVGD